MGLSDADEKLELIMGAEGLARLKAARVAVLGLGGVGSNCVEALVRGGVGGLFLVDRDIVQASNINRQAIAFCSTVGRRKVDVMRAMAADINPEARVETRHMLVLRENLDALLDEMEAWAREAGGSLDYVIDAIDTVSAKLALAEAAQRRGLRLISSMGAANKLHPECLRIADVYDTVNCPLCRIMRKEGRKRGIRSLRVLYSCEEPVRVAPREGAARSERSNLGTASFMPPIMGQMMAGAVIRELAGLEEGR
ncbi:MAG TPA: tRNA threonylcarbamoyladenosine dehydratase [Candidatus Aphodovivens avistercoris]|nr:tRNA threonylcarbamoyladenosine dehydratase [Candidatus Aphodovivens avistercoris]